MNFEMKHKQDCHKSEIISLFSELIHTILLGEVLRCEKHHRSSERSWQTAHPIKFGKIPTLPLAIFHTRYCKVKIP